MKRVIVRSALAVILVLTSCLACHEHERDEEADRARLFRMRQEIEELIGEAICTESSECHSIAFGAKPCGGPWEYLIYSTSTVDTYTLQQRVEEYNSFNEILNQRYGWISDCSLPNRPTVGCRDGRCVDIGSY